MKVIRAYPPNFRQIAAAFPVKGVPGIIYAYGDRIYAPGQTQELASWIVAHEEVHGKQQESGDGWDARGWWRDYIESPEFRLAQEIPAHRAEWLAYSRAMNGFVGPERYLDRVADRLSGPLYGNMISKDRAVEEIIHA